MASESRVQHIIAGLRGGLIVSCQAAVGTPLHGPVHMAAMAQAAEQGGAVGIRANGAADIAAIRAVTALPVIGIEKWHDPEHDRIVITPDFDSASGVVAAGAEIVALSCAFYQRPDRDALAGLIARIKAELGALVMADCATLAEGVWAAEHGADLVGTTLSGYTPDTTGVGPGPDLSLVAELAAAQPKPVIAEGRIWTPGEAKAALDAGAYAVVVGTAITAPTAITARFVARMEAAG
jgi:putative N-acetylmannosamine-6-phosphate epimerase